MHCIDLLLIRWNKFLIITTIACIPQRDLDPDVFVVMCQEWQHQDLIDRKEETSFFSVWTG